MENSDTKELFIMLKDINDDQKENTEDDDQEEDTEEDDELIILKNFYAEQKENKEEDDQKENKEENDQKEDTENNDQKEDDQKEDTKNNDQKEDDQEENSEDDKLVILMKNKLDELFFIFKDIPDDQEENIVKKHPYIYWAEKIGILVFCQIKLDKLKNIESATSSEVFIDPKLCNTVKKSIQTLCVIICGSYKSRQVWSAINTLYAKIKSFY